MSECTCTFIVEWSKQRVKRSKRNTPTGPNSDSWFHQRPGRSFGQSQSQFIRTQPCNGPHCSPQDHASAKSSSENAEAVVGKQSLFLTPKRQLSMNYVVVGPGGMGQAQSQYMPAQDYFSWGRRDSHRHGAPGKSGGLAHQNGQSGHQRAPPNHPRIQAPVGPPRRYQNQRPRPDGHRQGIPGSPGGLLKRGHHESLGNVPRTMFGHSRVKTTGQRNPNGNLERRRRLGSRRRSMFGRDSHSYGAPGTVGGFVSEGDSSQSESQVKVGSSQTMASASTNGAYGMRSTQSQVQGGFSGAGSFSGQSQSMGGWGQSSSSGITADKNGVSSQAGTSFQSNQGSQSQVQFTNTGEGMASSQTRYNNGGSSTSLHASGSGGLAGAQASGIGLTTSQAQIGFKAQGVTMRNRDSGFVGGGQAASQSQGTYGQSQSQLYGSFMDGVAFSGGAQAGSKTIDQRQSLDQNLNQESRGHTRKFHPDDNNANVANGQRDEKPFESHVDSDHSMQRRLPYGNYDGNQRTFMRDRQDNGVPLDDSTTSTSRGTAVQTQEAPFNGDSNHFYSRRQKSQSRSNVYEAGEEVPGFPGYRVPNGFRAKVSTSHAPETSSLVFGNGQSQSQTININKAHLRSNEINKQNNNINEEQETQISQPSEYYDYDYTEGDDDYYYYDDSYPTTPTYLTSTTTIVAPTFHRQTDMTDVQEGNGGVLPTQSPQYPDSAPPLSTENPNLTSETQQRGSQEGYVHGYRCRDNTNHLSPCAIFPWSGSLNIQGEGSWRLMPESSDRSSTGSPVQKSN